jgi:hypothetical protein
MMKLPVVSLIVAILATFVSARVGDTTRRLIQAKEPVPGSYIVAFHDNVTDVHSAMHAILQSMPGSTIQHVFRHALKGFSFQAGPLEAKAIPHVLNWHGVDYVAQVSHTRNLIRLSHIDT